MMIPGDEWKAEAAVPTAADILKYRATKARLLMEAPFHYAPFEATISEVVNEGEIFKTGGGGYFGSGGQWYRRSDVQILAVLPPRMSASDLHSQMDAAYQSALIESPCTASEEDDDESEAEQDDERPSLARRLLGWLKSRRGRSVRDGNGNR